MVREILVRWTTANGGGKVSVFNFIPGTPVADQRTALAGFLNAADAVLSNTATWTIDTSGVEKDTVTGELTGSWTDGTVHTGSGGAAGQAADATQVLVRWKTDTVINGRFLQGRTFLPALAVGNVTVGNLSTTSRATVLAAANGLITAAVQLAVWHRPVGGAGGAADAVSAADVWAELAVLRRRRG